MAQQTSARERATQRWERRETPPEAPTGDKHDHNLQCWRAKGGKWECHLFLAGEGYFRFRCDALSEIEPYIAERGWEED